MILAKPTMLDLLRLASQARPDEVAQYESLIGMPWNVDDVAAFHYSRDGVKYALVDEETNAAIVVGGYDLVGPQVWQSWMIGSMENWEKHWFAITRHSRRVMDDLFAAGARRLQTSAIASRTAACHWYVKGLRMEPEGVMRNYGLNGEDVAMFSRIRRA